MDALILEVIRLHMESVYRAMGEMEARLAPTDAAIGIVNETRILLDEMRGLAVELRAIGTVAVVAAESAADDAEQSAEVAAIEAAETVESEIEAEVDAAIEDELPAMLEAAADDDKSPDRTPFLERKIFGGS
jgi:hypothetical protein